MSEAKDLNFWQIGNRAIAILVIEDEPDFAEVLVQHLSYLRYEVHAAHSILEARKILDNNSINIVITDIRLPDGKGNEFILEIKPLCPDIQFIVITGHADLNEAKIAIQAQAVDFLQKPFKVDDLQKSVERAKELLIRNAQRVESRARELYSKKIYQRVVEYEPAHKGKKPILRSGEFLAIVAGMSALIIGVFLTWLFKF